MPEFLDVGDDEDLTEAELDALMETGVPATVTNWAGTLHATGEFEPLTPEEHEFLDLTGQLASRLRRIIGDGPAAAGDMNEAASAVHVLQRMVFQQAVARVYPDRYRLLGQSFRAPEFRGSDPPKPHVERPDPTRITDIDGCLVRVNPKAKRKGRRT